MVKVLENDKLAKKRLAQLIRDLRGQTTQREFAKCLGTSHTTVQGWERQVYLPNLENFERIAQLKGWTLSELINHIFCPDVQTKTMNERLPENVNHEKNVVNMTE